MIQLQTVITEARKLLEGAAEDEAFNAGRDAARRNYPGPNPYRKGTAQYTSWQAGYQKIKGRA